MEQFEISLESLKEVERLLTTEFTKGLESEEEKEDVKVKMFVTHVYEMPKGTEEGEFLVVDLGVNHLRVVHISESTVIIFLVSSVKFWRGSNFADRAFLNVHVVLRLMFADVRDYRICLIRCHGFY